MKDEPLSWFTIGGRFFLAHRCAIVINDMLAYSLCVNKRRRKIRPSR
jgi:hypothetical protein